MGLNYGVDLYIPVHRLDALLRAVALVADEPDCARILEAIPYRPARVFSVMSRCRTEPGRIRFGIRGLADEELDSQHIFWPLTLLVPVDQTIKNFRMPFRDLGGRQYAPLCYNFGVVAGDRYAQVILFAPTSDLSCLLVQSPSMSDLLKELVRASDGLGGLIDMEQGSLVLLDDPSQQTPDDWEDFALQGVDDVEGSPDIDYYVEALIARGALPGA